MHRVVRVERDAVERHAIGVLLGLDLDAVGVVGTHFVQRDDVRHGQTQQDQRDGNDVEREEAVQRCVAHHVVAADPDGEILTDDRDGGEQVDDHLGAPVRHLAPGEQVAEEGLGHQRHEDHAAEQPDQLARLAVRTVQQATEHVQVHHDEERRGAGGVHVAHQPAPGNIPHDVLDRGERLLGIRLVVHDQEDAGDDLDDQHQHGQRAKDVPEVEVLGRVVLSDVALPEDGGREAVVYPPEEPRRVDLFLCCHEAILLSIRNPGQRQPMRGLPPPACMPAGWRAPCDDQPVVSSAPINSVVSDVYLWGGTSRLALAGLFLNTRPAMSKVEP